MNKPLLVLTIIAAFGFSGAASAAPVPDAFVSTGSCTTSTTPDAKTCSQSNSIVSVFSQARLSDLTATANIDQSGPYSTTAQAFVRYYMELTSSTGSFPADYYFTIPISVLANGYTDVGGIPPAIGSSFNHNQATASVTLGGDGWYACAGYGCYPGATTSFSGGLTNLKPGSSASGYGGNIFEINVKASVSTNSNYPTSYAHAWADPTIQIDPTFLAANPQYSLSFSSNLPATVVPVPAAAWLFGSGLLGLIGVARRQSGRRAQ
jgi:hypothetical protein